MRASDYRAEARLMLRGKWGSMALAELIAAAVVGTLSSIVVVATVMGPLTVSAIRGLSRMINGAEATSELIRLPASFYVVLALGLALTGIAASLMSVGLCRAGIAVVRGKRPRPGMLFALDLLPKALAMCFVRAAIVCAGALLLVVPGVIAAYCCAMADYLLITRPDTGPIEALKQSARRMKGRKRKLFFVQLAFFLGQLLCSAPLIAVQARIRIATVSGTPGSLSLLTVPLALLAVAAGLFLGAWAQVSTALFFRRLDRSERKRAARRNGDAAKVAGNSGTEVA